METQGRASDGSRRFTAEFKRDQISRVIRGEVTLSELSREIDVSPSVVRRWKHLVDRGSQTAVAANEEGVPRAAEQRIKELERALGRKTLEVEILQAARDEVKKDRTSTACPRNDPAAHDGHLPDAAHRPGDGLPPDRFNNGGLRPGGGCNRDGADPDGDPPAGGLWGPAGGRAAHPGGWVT